MQSKPAHDWAALMEALGVFLLVMLYIWNLRIFYPSFWMVILGFVAGSHFPHREGATRLGLRWKEFRLSLRPVLPWIGWIAAPIVSGGMLLGTAKHVTPAEAALAVAVYSVWGLFQQYLLNGYFVNRMAEFTGTERSRAAPAAAAMLFSAAHLPNWFLMLVTLAGGYVCARVFLRYRSLYILAVAHGLIGFLLNLVVPDSITGNFLVGPRYVLQQYGIYPEQLL